MTLLRLGVVELSGPWEECLVVIRGLRACGIECALRAGSVLYAVLVTDVDIVDSGDDSASDVGV